MNLKSIFATILVVCSITFSNAQSKDILAKSAMLNADEAYANGQYSECLGFLKDAETNLGATNSRIQYLKVKSLMAMGTNDQYNKKIWLQSDMALKVFFEVTPENGYVPEKYEEMLLSIGRIKGNMEETQAVEAMEKIWNLPWNSDTKQKWMAAYQNYISRYPNGAYVKTAQVKIDKILYPERALTVALENNDIKEVIKCIEYGANPNIEYEPRNQNKEYLLNLTFEFHNFEDNIPF